MGLTIYREQDVDPSILVQLRVGVLGYGNQGHAHALNLRDSGVEITIGQRKGPGFDRAVADGFTPLPIHDAAESCDVLLLTLPDESAADIYTSEIEPVVHTGQSLGFVHGFNIRFGFIKPPTDVDVIMIAPKGPGTLLRSLYLEGHGMPSLMAIEQDFTGRAKQIALSWAAGIGSARAAIVETTFASETETDLFGEQAVLCGGVSALTKAAFETLVDAGYEPEFAYLECVHELKQIVDLLYTRGLSAMRDRISNTAEYGDLTRGPVLIDKEVRARMRQILEDVRSGAFAKEWLDEHRSGGKNFQRLHDADVDSPYEQAGETVRSLMPWLRKN